MKKIEVTKEQMVEALKVNGKEPWTVLGMKRRSWFDILKRNEVTMTELRSSANVSADSANVSADSANVSANVSADSANVPVRTIKPVPQWSPDVTKEANTVGRGGVRYRYTDTGKYNEFVKEDAFRIMERAMKNEVTHKPVEREIKPEIPEELLQYDQTDVPYEVWTKYIDESKGEHWGTFVMKYGKWLEPKKHNREEEIEKRASEKLGLGYFEKYLGKGGVYNPSRDSYFLNGEENFF